MVGRGEGGAGGGTYEVGSDDAFSCEYLVRGNWGGRVKRTPHFIYLRIETEGWSAIVGVRVEIEVTEEI